jgi:hypothetical protein
LPPKISPPCKSTIEKKKKTENRQKGDFELLIITMVVVRVIVGSVAHLSHGYAIPTVRGMLLSK